MNWNQQDTVMAWLKNYILKIADVTADLKHYEEFFNENVEKVLQPGSEDFIKYFVFLFYKINIALKNFEMHSIKLETTGTYGYKTHTKK